jgi:hypothetical protein
MGGVCATTCCVGCGAFAGALVGADVCDAAVRDARAKTAEVSKAIIRMEGLLKMISEKLYAANTEISKHMFAAGMSAKAKALQQRPEGLETSHQSPPTP